jgi:hypothetical protein
LRIYTSRRPDRSWVLVLASCLGVYLVLAVVFHWFLQPIVAKGSEATASKLPLVASPDRGRAEPATSGEFLRNAAQRSTARPPAPVGELARAETSEQPDSTGVPAADEALASSGAFASTEPAAAAAASRNEHSVGVRKPTHSRSSPPPREQRGPTRAAAAAYPGYSGGQPF